MPLTSLPNLNRLDAILNELDWLWRPQPFKERRPAWCAQRPQLTEALLKLTDTELESLSSNHAILIEWLAPHLPELKVLTQLCELPTHSITTLKDPGPHFNTAIPGRKLEQIESFAAAVGKIENPIVEWCGGKGHLGRRLANNWQQAVFTIEYNGELCHAGEVLAKKAKINQHFYKIDVLSADANRHLPKHHAIALHACGELHRTLIRKAINASSPAIDLVPCCYHLGHLSHQGKEEYTPFTEGLQLRLNRDALRLAVTETVTSGTREISWRDQEMAWKLGYAQLRRNVTGNNHYQTMKPINKQWLREGFKPFCSHLAQRDRLELNHNIDWVHFEQQGWQRQNEVMRLSLVRNAFRRPIEIWLVLDIGSYLSNHGYHVEIGEFCKRATTPRNILISARKRQLNP